MIQNNNYSINTDETSPTFKVYDKEGLKKHIRIAFLAEVILDEEQWDNKLIVIYSNGLAKTTIYSLVYDSEVPFISDLQYMVSFQTYYNGQNYAVVRPNLFNTTKDKHILNTNKTEQERILA